MRLFGGLLPFTEFNAGFLRVSRVPLLPQKQRRSRRFPSSASNPSSSPSAGSAYVAATATASTNSHANGAAATRASASASASFRDDVDGNATRLRFRRPDHFAYGHGHGMDPSAGTDTSRGPGLNSGFSQGTQRPSDGLPLNVKRLSQRHAPFASADVRVDVATNYISHV